MDRKASPLYKSIRSPAQKTLRNGRVIPKYTIDCTRLCRPCSTTDWGRVLMIQKAGWALRVAQTICSSSTVNACPLCDFFNSVKIKQHCESRTLAERLSLETIPLPHWLSVQKETHRSRKPRVYAVLSKANEFVGHASPVIGLARQSRPPSQIDMIDFTLLKQDQIEYSLILHWLKTCELQHVSSCTKVHASLFRLRALKLIDCDSRQLVEAKPDFEYVALSYVWGSSQSHDAGSRTEDMSLLDLPRTIEDAVTVTQRLGVRYIWIDRYCIDQTDDVHKARQIQQMNLIYRNAFMTLIAAAGTDPDYGLPGVSTTLRSQQPQFRVGPLHLVSSLSAPHTVIKASKWISRAWTYQEAFFSNKRLIFTDEQVYFECQSASAFEISPRFSEGENLLFNIGELESVQKLWTNISLYSRREMTFETDVVPAFEGVMQELKLRNAHFTHLHGIPIDDRDRSFLQSSKEDSAICNTSPDSMINSTQSRKGCSNESFLSGLSWQHTSTNIAPRRDHLPSWTWAGWKVEISTPFFHATPQSQFYSQAYLEDSSNVLHHVSALFGGLLKSCNLTRFVHLEGIAIPLGIRRHDNERPEEMLANAGMSVGSSLAHPSSVEDEDGSHKSQLFATLVSSGDAALCVPIQILNEDAFLDETSHQTDEHTEIQGTLGVILGRGTAIFMLVLRPFNGYYERLGYAIISETTTQISLRKPESVAWLDPRSDNHIVIESKQLQDIVSERFRWFEEAVGERMQQPAFQEWAVLELEHRRRDARRVWGDPMLRYQFINEMRLFKTQLIELLIDLTPRRLVRVG